MAPLAPKEKEGRGRLRQRAVGVALALLTPVILVLAAGSLLAPRLLRHAGDEFSRRASEPLEAWRGRHPARDADEATRRLSELVAGLDRARAGDPPPAVMGAAANAWFHEMIHVHAVTRAADATPLPASALQRGWMHARQAELDEIASLLVDGEGLVAGHLPDATPDERRRARAFMKVRGVLLSRALDDAARGDASRAERNLRAAWALDDARRADPASAWLALHEMDDTLGVLRVVRPQPAGAWIARLDAIAPRALVHEGIMWAASSIPAEEAALEEPPLPDFVPARIVVVKRPPARLLRALLISRLVSSLGELDARLAQAPPCSDTMELAGILPRSWLAREIPGEPLRGIDDALVVKLRACEVDLALTRRVLEIGGGLPAGTACANEWLTEARTSDGRIRLEWNGALPRGREDWRSWYPTPFVVEPAGARPILASAPAGGDE